MKSDYFYDLITNENSQEYISNLGEDVLFIYSPTSFEKVKLKNQKIKMVSWHHISKNVEKIEEFIKKLNDITEVVTFGGGSTIDIGKYIANKLNVKYTCILTMLSTNSYATNKTCLLKNNLKITLLSKMPDKIIVDNELLKLSESENLYGLADVLSIYTALYDWKIANEDINENIDIKIYNMAENLLLDVLKFIEENTLEEIISNNMKSLELIGISGYITNLYGTGRPESGSEHVMAKEIERRLDIPHGISVSIGIIIMSIMQERESERIRNAINKIKVFDKQKFYGINQNLIIECLENIKPKDGRYTIIDRYVKNKSSKEDILNSFFSKVHM